MRRSNITLFLLMISCVFYAQKPTQNIKGRVIDMDTHVFLPGVNVYLVGSNPPIGTISNADGYYILKDVSVGRYTIQYSFLGYDAALFKEVEVGAGKEVEINVSLKESFQQLDEVIVKPGFRKDQALNSMASLSARSFSVEEASRYAGGWNDPSRLAASYAGVSMAEGVNDNAIVIRGNAPKGILWRLEGIEIPAPNHLNGVNNGGGIETVFSVNMLANSDFFTGAFPAEYVNAMSGAFDMKFRNGNNNKQESTFQFGSQGIDLSSEGPFIKDGKSSYLFNYRYSTFGLVGQLVDGNFGLPQYQDLSFKLYLPTRNTGTLSVWGIGGLSSVAFDPDKDVDQWTNTFDNNKYSTGSDILATGITHHINLNNKSYLKTSLAYTYDRFKMKNDQMQRNLSLIQLANHSEENSRVILNTYLNHKFGKKHTNKTGLSFNSSNYHLNIQGNPNPGIDDQLIQIANQSGKIAQVSFYSQSKWRLSKIFDINVGMNLSYHNLNEEFIPEPRAGLTYRFAPRHAFGFAYGKHSKLEPIRFYQAKSSNGDLLNPDLKVSKAHHFVFSYDYRINENMKLKIEPYYQDLYDIPVIEGTSKSLINYSWNMYFDEALINTGKGHNVGIDITLERYMKDGFYYMFTASLFDSKYIGGDGIERNTSFNRGFVLNLLAGKEWVVRGKNTLGVNTKMAVMGGNRFTPADEKASAINEMVVLDESRAFEWQEDTKVFLDIAFNYKMNKKKGAHVLSIQIKNALMQSEMFGWAYDFEKQKVVEHGLTMMYPYFTYRIEF